MNKDSSETKICLKCSSPVKNGSYCAECESLNKTSSENGPSTLRESIDSVSTKFSIPRSQRIKKNEDAGILDGLL